ncbi:MAG: TOBE domain-containing protein [Symbiopectobacterium sp.]
MLAKVLKCIDVDEQVSEMKLSVGQILWARISPWARDDLRLCEDMWLYVQIKSVSITAYGFLYVPCMLFLCFLGYFPISSRYPRAFFRLSRAGGNLLQTKRITSVRDPQFALRITENEAEDD